MRKVGTIHSDLTIGANVAGTPGLKANKGISSFGMMLAGAGFLVNKEKAHELGLGRLTELDRRIRPYRNGRDLTSTPRGVMVIDMFPLSENEVRQKFPEIYQHLVLNVKPERDHNRDRAIRENWWLFGRNRQDLRSALARLHNYISTPETAKHRFFVLQDVNLIPDHKLVNIALDDYYHLGILSSKIHITWAMAAGGRLGVGNDSVYNSTRCFQTFPFPEVQDEEKQKIRELAEAFDMHRKTRQNLHPTLAITDMYNVMAKLHCKDPLTASEQKTHNMPS